jgi:hypothetical protein
MTSRTLGMLMAASLASFAWADDQPTGTYSALVDVGNEPTQLCLTVNGRGYATGTVMHQRKRYTVRGAVSDLWLSSNGRRVPLRMILPQGGEANGFLTIGGRTAAFAAARRSPSNIFAGRNTSITLLTYHLHPLFPTSPPHLISLTHLPNHSTPYSILLTLNLLLHTSSHYLLSSHPLPSYTLTLIFYHPSLQNLHSLQHIPYITK